MMTKTAELIALGQKMEDKYVPDEKLKHIQGLCAEVRDLTQQVEATYQDMLLNRGPLSKHLTWVNYHAAKWNLGAAKKALNEILLDLKDVPMLRDL